MKYTVAILLVAGSLLLTSSCENENNQTYQSEKSATTTPDSSFFKVMRTHLNAVARQDLELLKTTLSPTGDMLLILPNLEITHTTEAFLNMHREWFQDTTWTFEPTVLFSEVGEKVGFAAVEVMYKEPDRKGKPYFNRMAITYGLKKIEGRWYVISDHACSLDKTAN